MQRIEFDHIIIKLEINYRKNLSPTEKEHYYEYLKDLSKTQLKKSIEVIIKTSKFFPNVAEIVETVKEVSRSSKLEILDYMNSHDYFKNNCEYEKALSFVFTDVIPSWFKPDLKKYFKMKQEESLVENKRANSKCYS